MFSQLTIFFVSKIAESPSEIYSLPPGKVSAFTSAPYSSKRRTISMAVGARQPQAICKGVTEECRSAFNRQLT